MATYIELVSFTEQGVRNVKDTTKRAAAAKEMAKSFGVEIKSMHWTLGSYDLVVVFTAPDEEAVSMFNLSLAKQGNVRTQTLRAFDEGEMERILTKLP